MSPRATQQTLDEAPIGEVDLVDKVESSFLDYSMSVIADRALPDVRDGLKPVHRRILWGMHVDGVRPDRSYVKCARVVGSVMGKYHPHGDSALYDALVRLAQPFSLGLPLIDPHGNFGSPSMPPAASRYTECRLAESAMRLLEGIDEETVDFHPNFDGSETEPAVLPARFPNLLVNGAQGIAVGLATNIPPHNLAQVCAAARQLIDDPDATIDALVATLGGPDFPTGGIIMGAEGFREAYATGKGRVRLRARTHVEEGKRGARSIVVTQVPYQKSVDDIATKIAELVDAGTVEGIKDLRNESAAGETRLVIDLRSGADVDLVQNNLFKHTDLQTTFGMNLVALTGDGVPRTLNLKEILRAWVDHQVEVITRRTEFRLEKAEARLHIVEGLLKAIDMIDAIVALIRASADRPEAREGLMGDGFEFSEIQANHILDMPLAKLTQLGTKDLVDERKELRATIEELKAILRDREVLLDVIRGDLEAVVEDFGRERRCELTDESGEIDVTALVADEPLVVTVTGRGYLKAVPEKSRAAKVADPGDRDVVASVARTSTLGSLLVLTDRGKAYRIKGGDVPTAKLTAVPNLLQLAPDEQVLRVLDDEGQVGRDDRDHVVFVLASGTVKKSALADVGDISTRRDGSSVCKVADDDRVVAVVEVRAGDDLLLYCRSGQCIRFPAIECRPMGKAAAGVRGIRVGKGDEVVGGVVVDDSTEFVVVATEQGAAKRTRVEEYPTQGRAGKGVQGAKPTRVTGQVSAVGPVTGDEVLLVDPEGVGTTVRATTIPIKPRAGIGSPVLDGGIVAVLAVSASGGDGEA